CRGNRGRTERFWPGEPGPSVEISDPAAHGGRGGGIEIGTPGYACGSGGRIPFRPAARCAGRAGGEGPWSRVPGAGGGGGGGGGGAWGPVPGGRGCGR